jgi:hypothetical protein
MALTLYPLLACGHGSAEPLHVQGGARPHLCAMRRLPLTRPMRLSGATTRTLTIWGWNGSGWDRVEGTGRDGAGSLGIHCRLGEINRHWMDVAMQAVAAKPSATIPHSRARPHSKHPVPTCSSDAISSSTAGTPYALSASAYSLTSFFHLRAPVGE